jgi:hypothetical protein
MFLNNKWIKYLAEQVNSSGDVFQKNIDILLNAARTKGIGPYTTNDINQLTPENAKILTEFELGDIVGQGAFGRAFEIKNSDLVIKIFYYGVRVEEDVKRIQEIIEKVFKGTAPSGRMHYFDFGFIGEKPDPRYFSEEDALGLKYVIMPRIIPFMNSVVYKLNPNLFTAVSSALHATAGDARDKKINSYADFRDIFYTHLADAITFKNPTSEEDRKRYERWTNDYLRDMNEFDETIHKLVRIAFKTFTEQGGTDLHLGNLGFFRQKPDDWFFFDM